MGTLADELRADNRRVAEEGRELPGPAGATYRLIERFNPDVVGEWLMGEDQRGTAEDDIWTAIAQCIALALMVSGGTRPEAPHQAINQVLLRVGVVLKQIQTGEIKFGAVMVDPETGAEVMATSEGIMQGHDPFKGRG